MMNVDADIIKKILANQICYIKRMIHHIQVLFISGAAVLVQYSQIVNMIHYINKRKDKNHMIISIDAEKAFDII